MIHVCFGLHDKTGRYSKFTGTAMLSMFENTASNVTVHILHDNTLSTDNRDKFIYLAGQYGQAVKFYNVEKLCADKIAETVKILPDMFKKIFSIAAMYRLLAAQVLSTDIDKLIYLDSDIVVNLDIKKLWQIELGDKPLATVTEISNGVVTQENLPLCRAGHVKHSNYFNSGVLLMNLKFFRTNTKALQRGMNFLKKNPQFAVNFDQEILNYCFSTQTLKLPAEFNYFIRNARSRSEKNIEQKIYHYLSGSFGYGVLLNMSDPFNRLWMRYFIRTPWFDVDTIGRLYDGFKNIQVEQKQSTINLSAMMSGKTRAFFTSPQSVNAIKGIFSVRNDEEIILAKDNESLKKLLIDMSTSRGKKIFFIIFPNFPFEVLTKFGFVHGRDFVNGVDFLYDIHGMPTDSHPLIRAM